MKRVVILLSGRGSNMEAIARADIPGIHIAAVVSNRPDAAGLALARELGIETRSLDHKGFETREAFDLELARLVEQFKPDLVVLAGYMRILTEGFVRQFEGRMLNIHPSLLPAFTGLHTHRRAIEAGVKVAGATVHFVTAELDVGPIVIQAVVPVLPDDDEATLAARVVAQEHRIYPQAVRWFAEGRLVIEAGRVRLLDARLASNDWTAPPLER